MMKKASFILFMLILVASAALAGGRATLLEMKKFEGLGTTRITLRFSQIPACDIKVSGQRIDLICSETSFNYPVKQFPEDGMVVKSLLGEKGGDIVVSVLMRQVPQRVDTSKDKATSTLVLDVFWDKDQSKVRPVIVPSVAGVPTFQGGKATVKRSFSPAYAGHWDTFFTRYEVPLKIPAPVEYSLPAFPCLGLLKGNSNSIPLPAVIAMGKEAKWDEALERLLKIKDDTERMSFIDEEELVLLHGEILVRAGAFNKGIDVLSRLIEKKTVSANIEEYARFLVAYSLAVSGNPYTAAYELSILQQVSARKTALTPHVNLLQTEIALAIGKYDEVLKIVEDGDAICPDNLSEMRRLRRADACYALGKKEKAYKDYQPFKGNLEFFSQHPVSLAGFADLLYQHEEYDLSVDFYKELAMLLAGQKDQGLAFFAAARAQFDGGDKELALLLLENIVELFPGDEGHFRARIKLNDLLFLSAMKAENLDVIIEYKDLSEKASLRALREEAAFKLALVLYIKGDLERCSECLQDFLRDFGKSELRVEAEALMVEIMPEVIRSLIKDKKYLEALVVVEKNRKLFSKGQISGDFLEELGQAFVNMGFLDRAVRVYLYMLEFAKDQKTEQKFYRPLVQTLLEKGDTEQVENYTSRYAKRFPDGKDRPHFYFLRVKALHNDGKLNEAAELLNAKNSPRSRDLDFLAGKVFWDLGKYEDVEKYLSQAMGKDLAGVAPEYIFLRAESLFKRGELKKALPFYQHIDEKSFYFDQSLYRCSQICQSTGQNGRALKLLRQLAEKGKNPLWQKMAKETLALEAL